MANERVDKNLGLAFDRAVGVAVAAVFVARFGFGVLVLGLEIDHQHPQRHAHLNCGQADPGGDIHRLEHIIDQPAQVVVEHGDPGGDLPELRIGNFKDFA